MSVRVALAERVAHWALIACALIVTGLVIRREVFAPAAGAAARDDGPAVVDEWKSYASAGQRVGPDHASVVITVFSDYECPFCKSLDESLRGIRREFPDQVAVVMRHYPLGDIHENARPAALAVECAASAGRFAEFHTLLFDNVESLGERKWGALALEAGIPDTSDFVRCIVEERLSRRIREDVEAAETLNIRGTPMLLVNEVRLTGAPTDTALRALVAEKLRE